MSTRQRDRVGLWLPLLRELTLAAGGWAVWKNVDAVLAGVGDLDTTAPQDQWPAVRAVHAAWADANGLGPIVACHHAWPGVLLLVAADRGRGELVEVDVVDRCPFRGSQLFAAADLTSLLCDDPRGFRRLRPGAEGLLKLALNGSRWGGRPDHAALAGKDVGRLLAADVDGMREAAALFGAAGPFALRAAEAVRAGAWDRRAMRVVEAHAVVRGVVHPVLLAQRVRRHLQPHRLCSVRAMIREGRRVTDVDAWLEQAAADHEVATP